MFDEKKKRFFEKPFSAEDLPKERISREEEVELINKIMSGNKEAVNKLVVYHLSMLQNIAIKFSINQAEYDDFISIGVIALVKAAKKAKIKKGVRFKYYAYKCIWGDICDYRDSLGIVRVPATLVKKLRHYRRDPGRERDPELEAAYNILRGYHLFFDTLEHGEEISGDFEKLDREEFLAHHIEKMSDVDKTIINSLLGRGCERKTMIRICEEVNLCYTSVKQHATRIIKELREAAQNETDI